jgi:hypothetical protein
MPSPVYFVGFVSFVVDLRLKGISLRLTKLMGLKDDSAWKKEATMKSRNIIYVLFILIALSAASICAAEETADSATASATVPEDNLPAGFSLLAVNTASTQGINMTEEIEDFYGAEDIGPANATVGIYTWGELGKSYDAKVTLISLEDVECAEAAISNYKSLPEFKNPPYRGIDRFSTATVNGHEVTEIRDAVGGTSLRYIYLWNNGSTVVLVEGNGDRSKSLELASATGL